MTVIHSTIVVVAEILDGPDASEIDRIIVPIDGSAGAIGAVTPAADLARRSGARLQLLTTIVEDLEPHPDSDLDTIASSLDGVSTQTVTRPERDPVEAVQALAAEEGDHAWVVMSSHGRGRVAGGVLGSVAERIVADVRVPTIVVGPTFDPDAHRGAGPVVVAHDGEHALDLEPIITLCRVLGAAVIPVRVPASAEPGAGPSGPSLEAIRWMDDLEAAGVELARPLSTADSPEDLATLAAEADASVLAVSTRSNAGVRRLVLGTHAAAVVRHSRVPVLVQRLIDPLAR